MSSIAGTSGARAKGLSRSELLKRAGVAVTAAAFGGAGIGQQFAKNKDAAEKFLVDLCAGYEGATIASNLFNFPSFPGAFPAKQLYKAAAADTHAPHGKYSILTTVASKYTCNAGYPGYTNAAVQETLDRYLIPHMFAGVSQGRLTAAESVRSTAGQMKRIWARGHAARKV